MDGSESGDMVSVAPSVVSELSSFGTLSDVENETEAVANGGSAETGFRGVTRHPLFWFENDIVNVHVENVAFQVHAHLFTRESDKGRALMSEASGGTLVLEDVKAIEFERFLTMLYAKFYDAPKLATAEEWSSVLHLAHKWDFASLQAVATRELDPLTTAVDKIVLSQQYDIDFWLEQAYLDVCTADDWLSDTDGLRLGVSAVLKIGRARHELLAPASLKPEAVLHGIVRTVFGLADAIESPASIPASGSSFDADEPDVSSDNASVSALPSSDVDVESAKEDLKSFVENTFGWSGSDARKKWSFYQPYGTSTERNALCQAVAEARLFVARAQSGGLDAREHRAKGMALLEAAKRAFEPIKTRLDAMTRFREWLSICLELVREDPWISSANRSKLEEQLCIEWRKLEQSRQSLEHNHHPTGQPYITADTITEGHRELEAAITVIFGSCPPMLPSAIQSHY